MQSTFRYDVHAGTAGDTYADTGTLTFSWQGAAGVSRILEFTVWDSGAFIILSYNGTDWGDPIELDPADPPIQIPHAARAFQIRNAVAGNNARYQIVAYW